MSFNILEIYKTILKIRRVEETLLKLVSEGKIFGTTHTSIGQEAIAMGVMSNIKNQDVVFSNHRCHGHYIAYGGPLDLFFAEIMGKETGLCKGRGGSQHIQYKNFYSNGIQGGIVGNATGIAFSQKFKEEDGMTVVFLGDGTMGQGLVYESMNLASLWNLPILFVVENNQYAMSTHYTKSVAGKIHERAQSFGIDADEIESNDVFELMDLFSSRFEFIRKNQKPFMQVIKTYRVAPHSKGDDHRDQSEIEPWLEKDPLLYVSKRIDDSTIAKTEIEVKEEIDKALQFAYSSKISQYPLIQNEESYEWEKYDHNNHRIFFGNFEEKVLKSINKGLSFLLSNNDNAVLIGEDLGDPYGGAFKVTKGLSTKFPKQVWNTPISEAAIIAISIGMSMNGLKPITELMFGDFVTLAMDQILNHAAKYEWMYGDKVNIPIIIRVPMGGRRGYGPTHSQSLEKLFLGIPLIKVVAISNLNNPEEIIKTIFNTETSPVILVENKMLYGKPLLNLNNNRLRNFEVKIYNSKYPIYHLSIADFENPDAIIITYGSSLDLAISASEKMMIEDEILVDVISITQISQFNVQALLGPTSKAKVILTLEEGTKTHSWGDMVISELVTKNKLTDKIYIKIASEDYPIPNSRDLENEFLPSVDDLTNQLRRVLNEEQNS